MRLVKMALLAALAFAAAATAATAATAADSAEQVMQGAWRLTGTNGAHGWYLEWTFDHGKFKLDGYPPLHQEGKYRVVKEEGDKLTLELYEQQGNFGTENSQIEVVVDKDKDALKIKDQGPFKRSAKS
jgi:hypothetical protein